MSKHSTPTEILILGGGFGGVKCALELAKKHPPNTHIRLVSDRKHFEYHGALYRLVTGSSPLEVCIPLETIFQDLNVEVVKDQILQIDQRNHIVRGQDGSYRFDFLVIGLGSETSYYNTPGLEKYSFGFKTIDEALSLKRHIHEIITTCSCSSDKQEQLCNAHFVVVGGGASGTELAADLVVYAKHLAKDHGIDPSLVTVDLIHSPNRLMPTLPKSMSVKIEEKLRSLGVNVYLNRRVVKEDITNVYLKDMKMQAKTLIWTAGVTGNRVVNKHARHPRPASKTQQDRGSHKNKQEELPINPRGQLLVNEYLQVKKHKRIFAVGDIAATVDSGMAQTALAQGTYLAEYLSYKIPRIKRGRPQAEEFSYPKYHPIKPIYAIPVGPGWAAVLAYEREFYGKVGWMLRRYLDWVVYTSLLPLPKAWTAFRSHGQLCEQCIECSSMPTQAPSITVRKHSEIKAILFDIGGVVVHKSHYAIARNAATYFSKKAKDISQAMIVYYPKMESGNIDEAHFWQHVTGELVSKQVARDLLTTPYKKAGSVNQDILDIIVKLQSSYRVGCLSNTNAAHAQVNRDRDVFTHFNPCILSHKIKMVKPNQEIYVYALNKLKLKANQVLFIDDNETNTNAAKKIGMHAHTYTSYNGFIRFLKQTKNTL
jgi:HAD superfamily hydrolase (TIGR01509 family)